MKKIALGQLFTRNQFEAAVIIMNEGGDIHFQLREKIVKPSMERINHITQQQNNADYWAYVLEYAIIETQSETK